MTTQVPPPGDLPPGAPDRADELALVAQVVDYAIFGLDLDGRVTSWNAGAAALKGWSAEEAVGQHFSVFYPEADRDAGLPEQLLARAGVEGRVEHRGWRVRKDGSRFWGDVVITAVHDGVRPAHRLHQGDPRPHRAAPARGGADVVPRRHLPRLPHAADRDPRLRAGAHPRPRRRPRA